MADVKKQEIEQHCTELVTPIIEEHGFELVDVEYVKEGSDYYLRVYADKEGGINIDDCVLISRSLEEKLDAADRMTDPYILEVSSPGLTRPLKKDKDFKRNLGKKVEVKLYRAVDGSKEFEAILTGYTDTTITLQLDPAEELRRKKLKKRKEELRRRRRRKQRAKELFCLCICVAMLVLIVALVRRGISSKKQDVSEVVAASESASTEQQADAAEPKVSATGEIAQVQSQALPNYYEKKYMVGSPAHYSMEEIQTRLKNLADRYPEFQTIYDHMDTYRSRQSFGEQRTVKSQLFSGTQQHV